MNNNTRVHTPRGASVAWIFAGMWCGLLLLLGTQLLDAWQRSVPPVLLFFWFTPLLILLPGMLRDRLRSVTWMAFVSLMYFIWSVLRIFAEPHSVRAQIELAAVILLFICSSFYVRQRGRELRCSQDADTDADTDADIEAEV
ncbi:DUF2069 domain-containing protein [Congregibacter variabilis]|uniref:DUF2069 domain-containing protein n=1 Tax=Congregibacter variabilis TaxID=3081200 RepID=A0ABZ0I2Z6_9GAMM|nr:DUF2069 domain-containing protein [Congregibacter sp. IMCC43200]